MELLEALAPQQVIDDCDRKITNYRALLDAGTDPTLVAGWIAEVTATRVAAQARQRTQPEVPDRTLHREYG